MNGINTAFVKLKFIKIISAFDRSVFVSSKVVWEQ